MFKSFGLIISVSLLSASAMAGEWDLGGEIGAELRSFPEGPAYAGQLEHFQPSLQFRGDVRYQSEDRKHQFVFVPYARIDAEDEERTHFDVREGYYRFADRSLDLLIGVGKVFWGVTESRHLVDIVNQTDAVEDIDEEDKLGQPMVKLSLLKEWGKLDFFVLPYFRERTFPGIDGRLRAGLVVDTERALYEDGDEEWNTDFALRYSHYFGDWDVGISAFSGTSREPIFVPIPTVGGSPVLRPFYAQINQLGVDVQYTQEAWLWKFEGIVREGQGDTFAAAVAGFEYTFYGVTDSGADLGVLMEYLYDGRDPDKAPLTVQQNDLFYGMRFAFNDSQDTSILAGGITDLEDGSTSGLVEAERRLGQNWKAEFEARFIIEPAARNPLNAFSQDSALTLRLTRYF